MDPFTIANQQYFDNVPENYDVRPQSIELAKRCWQSSCLLSLAVLSSMLNWLAMMTESQR